MGRRRPAGPARLDGPALDGDDRPRPDPGRRLRRRRRVAARAEGGGAIRWRPPVDRHHLARLSVRLQRRGQPLHALHRRIGADRRLPHAARAAGVVLDLSADGPGRPAALPGRQRRDAGGRHLPRTDAEPGGSARSAAAPAAHLRDADARAAAAGLRRQGLQRPQGADDDEDRRSSSASCCSWRCSIRRGRRGPTS